MLLPVHRRRRQTLRSMLEILLQVRGWIRCFNEELRWGRGKCETRKWQKGKFPHAEAFCWNQFHARRQKQKCVVIKALPPQKKFHAFRLGLGLWRGLSTPDGSPEANGLTWCSDGAQTPANTGMKTKKQCTRMSSGDPARFGGFETIFTVVGKQRPTHTMKLMRSVFNLCKWKCYKNNIGKCF